MPNNQLPCLGKLLPYISIDLSIYKLVYTLGSRKSAKDPLHHNFEVFLQGNISVRFWFWELRGVLDGIDHWNFLSGHYDDRHHGEVDDDADGDDSLLLTLFHIMMIVIMVKLTLTLMVMIHCCWLLVLSNIGAWV